MLFKAIFRRRNCFLSSVATDDKDGRGLKLNFSSFNALPCRTLLWFFIALKEHQFLGEGSIFSELKRQEYSRDKALLKDDPRFF